MSEIKNASLIGGHAQYAKGAVDEIFGNLTGDLSWKYSGAEDEQQAVDSMRTANQRTGYSSIVSGSTKKKIVNIVGCEGMVHNREEKQQY